MASVPWAATFGIKSTEETVVDGVPGLVIEGYASKYNVVDQSGEYQVPGSFADVVDAWGRQAKPVVDFNHGFDPVLGAAPIGWALEHRTDDTGLYVKCFLPRDPTPPFQHNVAAKTRRYREVYAGVKGRAIRGFSVTGVFSRVGKALTKWSMNALAVTPRPCLGEHAEFALGAKAVAAALGVDESALDFGDAAGEPGAKDDDGAVLTEQSTHGVLSRPAFNTVMRLAQAQGARHLHDHLLTLPHALQGTHDAEDCGICSDRRSAMGVKDSPTKTEPDGQHGADHYLYVGDAGQPSTWKLRYKDASGTVSPRLLGAAHAALTVGYRGNTVDLPEDTKTTLLARLRRLYAAADLTWPEEGSGGKVLPFPGADQTVAEALALVEEVLAGAKKGTRHSRETRDAVRRVIEHLSGAHTILASTFGVAVPAPEVEPDADDAAGMNGVA